MISGCWTVQQFFTVIHRDSASCSGFVCRVQDVQVLQDILAENASLRCGLSEEKLLSRQEKNSDTQLNSVQVLVNKLWISDSVSTFFPLQEHPITSQFRSVQSAGNNWLTHNIGRWLSTRPWRMCTSYAQLPWAEASELERTVLGGGVLLEAWPERISPRIGQLRIGDFLSFFF